MTSEPNDIIANQTRKYFDVHGLDYRIIFSDSEFDSTGQTSKLLLFHASWSGPSIVNIHKILGHLEKYTTTNLEIFIADIDYVSDDFKQKYLGRLSHGWGEAAWVENGQTKSKHTSGIDFPAFLDFIDGRLERKHNSTVR